MQKNACSVSRSLRKQRLTAIIFCLLAAFTLPVPLQAGVPQQQSTYPVNGLVTFDRRVCKMDPARMRKINKKLHF